MEHKEIVKNLVIIGSIIGIIQSILAFANLGFGFWGLMLAANILL